MRKIHSSFVVALVALVGLAGCGEEIPRLMNVKSGTGGPDEFSILPTKPLQAPEDYASLPTPTPGDSNLTDPTPIADAVASLGGRPSLLVSSGVARADTAVVSHASRYGVTANIRQVLAEEDAEYRRRNNSRLLERWFNVNVYFRAYKKLALDQYAELARFRRAGIATPAAPPDPEK